MTLQTKLKFLFPVLQFFVASVGVILAVFFQAWGLPIFLFFTLVLSWLIQGGKNYKIGLNGNLYLVFLMGYFLALVFLLPFFDNIAGAFIKEFLNSWDKISLISIQTLELPFLLPESKFQASRQHDEIEILSVKLWLNFIALTTPIITAYCLTYDLGKPAIVTFKYKVPIIYRLMIGCILVLPSIFAFWGMEHIDTSNYYLSRLVALAYYIQTFIPLLLLRILNTNNI